ncbi:hypothetical protein CR513_06007, partial [Mucuna pruriens]
MRANTGRTDPMSQTTFPPTFWGQPFKASIDQVYISGGDDVISCKLLPKTLRGVAMQSFLGLSPKTIHTFNDLVTTFVSYFAANRAKLEVTDLFDIKQAKEESLKKYLACFNNKMVQVNNPDQKICTKAYQKGLQVGQFSVSLALRRSTSIGEIRTKAEKHVEAKEDQVG